MWRYLIPFLSLVVFSGYSALIIQGEMISDLLHHLDTHRFTGPGGIHRRVLQDLIEVLAEPPSIITYQQLCLTREVPLDWKSVNVPPNYKKFWKENPGNELKPCEPDLSAGEVHGADHTEYHPMAHTGQLGHQGCHHGFTKSRSCLTNLISFYDQVFHLVEEGKVDGVYLAFIKPLDTVSHNMSLEKLVAQGLGGDSLLGWGQMWEVQQGQVLDPALGSWQPLVHYSLGKGLESCPAEKGLGVLVDSYWTWSSRVPRWPIRPRTSWPVSEIVWPAGPEQWLPPVLCTVKVTPWILHWVLDSSHQKVLECAQRKAEKLLMCLDNISYENGLRQLGLFSQEKGRLRGDFFVHTTLWKKVVARWESDSCLK